MPAIFSPSSNEQRGRPVKVTCQRCGDVVIDHLKAALTLDDTEGVYRFTCPRCNLPTERTLTPGIFEVLRAKVGALTLEEQVQAFAYELEDDTALARILMS